MNRRDFLRRLAAVGAGSVGLTATISPAAALARDEYKPEHVSLDFDRERLERYRPRLVFEEASRDQLIGLYGWYATSPEYDTDVAVYWASYTHQEGVTDFDSHYGDHEPLYVFVDSVTGEVQRVVYSAYHWLKGTTATSREHPQFTVVHPWHHYVQTTTEGLLVGVDDLHGVFDSWLANGLEEDLAPGSVVNPWSMRSRSDWWRRGSFGISLAEISVSVAYRLGLHDARRTDL